MPAIESVTLRRDMIDNLVQTLINNQYVFIGVLVLFAGIIFFGSIVNSSLVSLAERQREVATLRALGMGPWEVGGIFLRESLLVNLVGTLLGLPFGYLLVQLTSWAYAEERPDPDPRGDGRVGLVDYDRPVASVHVDGPRRDAMARASDGLRGCPESH